MNTFAKTACALLLSYTACTQAAEPASCNNIKLGSTNWSDTIATTAMAEIALEALGYNVKLTTGSQQIILAGMADNKLDAFLGYWQPTMQPVAESYINKGSIEVYKPAAVPDAQSTFAVPRFVYEGGLRTFADIARFKDKLGGRIYVIEPGSGSNRITAKLIADNAFGLGGFQLMESSEAGMVTAVKRAIRRNEWIVFFGWKPHPMNMQMDIAYLSGSNDAFGPNEGAATVSAMTAKGYEQRCPNAAKLLHNLRFKSRDVSELMVPILDSIPPKAAALSWLRANSEKVKEWFVDVQSTKGDPGYQAFIHSING